MKSERHSKIIELVRKNDIETQEELSNLLQQSGFQVTQATVSRDIRELKLTKVTGKNGKQKYAIFGVEDEAMLSNKYANVFREGFISLDMAMNILVVHTVSGMAGAVCAALDAMNFPEIVGTIAGDDTILCACRSVEETAQVMNKLRKIVG